MLSGDHNSRFGGSTRRVDLEESQAKEAHIRQRVSRRGLSLAVENTCNVAISIFRKVLPPARPRDITAVVHELYENGWSPGDIARELGISQAKVRGILSNPETF